MNHASFVARHLWVIFGFSFVTCVSCKGEDEKALSGKPVFHNPVIGSSTPDPSIIRVDDGSFYLYSTENIRNIPVFHSTDLVRWKLTGTAFTDETRPNFEPLGRLWAPDINYINGQYVLYYSMSEWGGEWTCGIGIATSGACFQQQIIISTIQYFLL
jgi:arabinan endo-1,5-alpha-L-arabinosidase